MTSRIPSTLLTLLSAILITGCAGGPKGPLYREVKASGAIAAPPNKGVVLVYWVSSFAEGGLSENANHTKVYANDLLIQDPLKPGGFCSYMAEPGPLRISSGALSGNKAGDYVVGGVIGGGIGVAAVSAAQKKDRMGFEVAPGETYFLETHTGMFQESMKPVAKEEGEKRIQNCHWLNPPASQQGNP